jgi:hypothetical protein
LEGPQVERASPTSAGVAADGSVRVQQLSFAFAAEFRR